MAEMAKKIPYCSQCRHDGPTMDAPLKADYMVKGRLINLNDWDESGGARYFPYRGNVCDYHYQMLLEDGAELRVIRTYPDTVYDEKGDEVG